MKELQNWLSGILVWHRDCRRYGEADLRHTPGTPTRITALTGLGTSAARVLQSAMSAG